METASMLAAMSTRFVLALLFFSGCKQTVAPAPVPRVALRAQAHAAYEQKRYADCARLFSDANSVEASTEAGGSDGGGRSLRYLEWAWQRDGQRDGYVVDYTLVTRSQAATATTPS